MADDGGPGAATDLATVLGLVGGGITVLVALAGYFAVPLITGDAASSSIVMVGLETFRERTVAYHLAVIGGPSFLATLAGVLAASNADPASRTTDLRVVGWNVLVPLAAVVVLYVLGAVVVGVSFSIGATSTVGGADTPFQEGMSLLGGVLTFLFVTLMALLLGGLLVAVGVFPWVLLSIIAGTLGGYLLARAVTAVRTAGREPDHG